MSTFVGGQGFFNIYDTGMLGFLSELQNFNYSLKSKIN
ncbi:Hypothetical Protein SLY_0409 [Strawberry lethal yellows phytoplasma (CPA) str. NZSb11]|uniref:Uncharacterized protein n=1 Tax=Strawberry lethal yellows phytoplasma (CPA) str. NZSb11 TaxID=980422 RepID=R4S0J9_PHYAS|nr:Hypothetical Protein SLY_0409 [Strawberry lethal yellows phytoplasma (CPA) str. NZSb11]